MKFCPMCRERNADAALQCKNCDAPFPAPPPSPAPPAPPEPPDPPVKDDSARASETAELQRVKQELADEKSKNSDLRRRLAPPDSQNDQLPSKPSEGSGKHSVLGLTAVVGLVQNWPKVATGAASIVATLGTAFTAFHFGVGGLGAAPDGQATAKPTSAAAAVTNDAKDPHLKEIEDLKTQVSAEVSRREESEAKASGLESQLAVAKGDLTAVSAARDGFKDRVSGLETQLSGSRQELAKVTAARDQAVGRGTTQAQPRVQAKVEPPRMGYFDFAMPDVKNDAEFAKRQADIGGDPRNWPSADCTVVTLIPLDGKDRPFPVAASCRADRILMRKPKGLNKDRVVRLIWQLQ